MDFRPINTGFTHAILLTATSDNITGATGRNLVITLYKNASTSSSSSTGTISEMTKGLYKIAFTSNDTDTLGLLVIHASATDSNPTDVMVRVVAVDPFSTSQAYTLTSTGAMTLGTAQSFTMTAGGVLIDAGTSTGRISLSSGAITLATAQSFTMTAGGVLLTAGTSTGQIQLSSGAVMLSTSQAFTMSGGGVLVTAGTSTGQIALSSGAVTLSSAQTFSMPGGGVLLTSGTAAGQVTLSSGTVAVTSNVKKNQALSNFEFLMTDTGGVPITGRNVTLTRSIDGGAFSTGTLSTSVEVASGMYRLNFGAGDLNGDVITLRATAAGASDRLITLVTAP